jgi:hypothetical protein
MPDGTTSIKVVTGDMRSSGMRDGSGDAMIKKVQEKSLAIDALSQSFARFLQSLQQIISVEQPRVGDFVLDEVTFSAEIGADGEFKLLGAGVGVSASSGISFTLRREPAKA